LIVKFCTRHGRFPAGRSELPDEAVAFVAKQVRVPASDLGFYEWSGRTAEYHRNQVREHLGLPVSAGHRKRFGLSCWVRAAWFAGVRHYAPYPR